MKVLHNLKKILVFGLLLGALQVNAQMQDFYVDHDVFDSYDFYENLSRLENYNEEFLPQLRDVDPEIHSILKSSNGKFTPQLRNVFLKKAKETVLDSLQSLGKQVDQNMLSWLDSDSMARDAVYGSISPVDPDILLNLNQLWQELGAEFTKKYKNLTLSAAIARRGFGVDSLPTFGWWGSHYPKIAKAKKKGMTYTELMYKNWKPAKAPSIPAAKTIAYKKVKEFLAAENLTYKKAWVSEKAKIKSILNVTGSKPKVRKKIYDCLFKLLRVYSTQMPWRRTCHPRVSDYIKYIVNIVEIPASTLSLTNKQNWPYFPTLTAPWPLMMPLARTLPLDECQYIFEKYQGKHGKPRLHAYGPYISDTRPNRLVDRPWTPDSYPAVIKIGGVCGTMSTIAASAYTGLGRPSVKVGQPGHSALVSYSINRKGESRMNMEQSIAGPLMTWAFWFFRDGRCAWKGLSGRGSRAHHHDGLALSMNFGLTSYMDTRIALHIHRTLPQQEQEGKLGSTLLLSTLRKNPCNTEVSYTLAAKTTDGASIVVFMDSLPSFMKDTSFTKGLNKNMYFYRKRVFKTILSRVLTNPNKFTPEDQLLILNYLKKIKSKYKPQSLFSYNIFKRKIIPWEQLSIKSAPDDSSKVAKIIDNNTNSFWLLKKKHPVEIVIEADSSYDISGLKYYSRSNGAIKDYLIFVSNDGIDWGDTIVSSRWKRKEMTQLTFFEPVKGKYFKYVALNTQGGSDGTGIREMKILYTPSNITAISSKDALHNAIPVITSVRTSRGVQFRLNSNAAKSGLCKIYNIQGIMVRAILPVKAKGSVSYTVKREGLAQQLYIVKINLGNSFFIRKMLF